MSFQHFRLGENPLHQPIPSSQPQVAGGSISTTKQPYGSGDTDDGYTLVFSDINEFQAWRTSEEENNCVEFVKGDTHGSKADPPRFKDHTKLVCARHSRSGRKKYVKKHPERVRKVPTRKLEGQGCQASISYKTYFDTDEVRACYISQHSHEIGLANLPFTRRGRKATVQQEKERGRNKSVVNTTDQEHQITPSSNPPSAIGVPANQLGVASYTSAVSMIAPLPGQTYSSPQSYGFQPTMQPYPPVQPQQNPAGQERWDNMSTLFQTVREHARSFEYPAASVAALETVLIRLYLESPMGLSPQQTMGSLIQNGLRGQPTAGQGGNSHQILNGTGNDGPSITNADETS